MAFRLTVAATDGFHGIGTDIDYMATVTCKKCLKNPETTHPSQFSWAEGFYGLSVGDRDRTEWCCECYAARGEDPHVVQMAVSEEGHWMHSVLALVLEAVRVVNLPAGEIQMREIPPVRNIALDCRDDEYEEQLHQLSMSDDRLTWEEYCKRV